MTNILIACQHDYSVTVVAIEMVTIMTITGNVAAMFLKCLLLMVIVVATL